jgi:hypothetical protein
MDNQQETNRFITILVGPSETIRGHFIQLFVLNNRKSKFIRKYKNYINLKSIICSLSFNARSSYRITGRRSYSTSCLSSPSNALPIPSPP